MAITEIERPLVVGQRLVGRTLEILDLGLAQRDRGPGRSHCRHGIELVRASVRSCLSPDFFALATRRRAPRSATSYRRRPRSGGYPPAMLDLGLSAVLQRDVEEKTPTTQVVGLLLGQLRPGAPGGRAVAGAIVGFGEVLPEPGLLLRLESVHSLRQLGQFLVRLLLVQLDRVPECRQPQLDAIPDLTPDVSEQLQRRGRVFLTLGHRREGRPESDLLRIPVTLILEKLLGFIEFTLDATPRPARQTIEPSRWPPGGGRPQPPASSAGRPAAAGS